MDYNERAQRAIAPQNCVGLISRVYGKGGELVVKLLDNFPSTKVELLWVEIDHIATPLFLHSIAAQGASKAVVVFDDFRSEELSSALLGLKVYSEQAQAEDVQESELDYLVGYAFSDSVSGNAGKVVEVYDSALNPLMSVDFGGDLGEVLVPIADDLVKKLDERKRVIIMSLAEGFFE